MLVRTAAIATMSCHAFVVICHVIGLCSLPLNAIYNLILYYNNILVIDDGKEILSPCEILQYLLDNQSPVVDKLMLDKCMNLTNREWMEYVEGMQGSIVTHPGKRPSSIRLDQLDRDYIKPNKDRDTPNEVN